VPWAVVGLWVAALVLLGPLAGSGAQQNRAVDYLPAGADSTQGGAGHGGPRLPLRPGAGGADAGRARPQQHGDRRDAGAEPAHREDPCEWAARWASSAPATGPNWWLWPTSRAWSPRAPA